MRWTCAPVSLNGFGSLFELGLGPFLPFCFLTRHGNGNWGKEGSRRVTRDVPDVPGRSALLLLPTALRLTIQSEACSFSSCADGSPPATAKRLDLVSSSPLIETPPSFETTSQCQRPSTTASFQHSLISLTRYLIEFDLRITRVSS